MDVKTGIYKIENLVNGKVYIGQSKNIYKRWYSHHRNVLDPRKSQYIYRAMRKYGINNFKFDILEECEIENLCELEKKYIKKYKSFNNEFGYNDTLGGEFGFLSDSARAKLKESLKNSNSFQKYQKEKRFGQKRSDETKCKQRLAAIESWKRGRSTINYRGGITQENREIISNLHRNMVKIQQQNGIFTTKGFKFSEESKKKMSEKAKRRCGGKTFYSTKGHRWMTDGINSKMVKPDEVNIYLEKG